MISKIAHLPHRSLRYFEVGSGRPLLLLHAFPLSADQWLPQLHRVPQGWRFIAPDLRGFRGAGVAFEDPGLSNLSMDDYADDVLALMAHLEVTRATVGGVSMGGYVAFALWRRAPARIAGLVLSNTRAAADGDEARAGRQRMIDLVNYEGPEAIARAMVPRLLGTSTRAEQPDLVDAVHGLVLMNSAEAIATALGALRDRPDSTPMLPGISVPTLIIAGDEDVVTPVAEAEIMKAGIPASTVSVLHRAGHLSNLEDSAGWNAALANWLTLY